MSKTVVPLHRRRFLKTALSAGAAVMAPQIIPSSALGRDGAVAPSERIVVGGIGIGNRGTYDLGCFLEQKDVQFVAVCDIKAARRTAVKKIADQEVRQSELRHVSRFSRTARPQRYRRGADRHRTELACHGRDERRQGRQGHVLREALHEKHRAKPDTGRHDAPHRPRVSGRHAAAKSAALCLCLRAGPNRQARQAQARLCPPDGHDGHDQRLAACRARTGQGSRRLGHVPGARGLAAVQSQAARRFQFRKRGRPGRRRRAGMGLALRRPLPMGRRSRSHGAGRVQPAEGRPDRGAVRKRRRVDLPRERDGFPWARARCDSKARPAGSKRATAASWC